MSVEFPTLSGVVTAVKNVSFKIGREKVGIIGESGSGKEHDGPRHHAASNLRQRSLSRPTACASRMSIC
jgi:ABC-type microcin C transport system duplicated ATPase subunit YejF